MLRVDFNRNNYCIVYMCKIGRFMLEMKKWSVLINNTRWSSFFKVIFFL